MQAGRELDALVAEKVFNEPFRPYAQILTSHPAKSVPETPFYSTDMAAAWSVAEKLKAPETTAKDTWPSEFQLRWLRSHNGWLASFEAADGGGYNVGEISTSAPLAICKAALKAVGHPL